MIILKTKDELTEWRNKVRGTVGFVPTMGNLHQGHLRLMHQALIENDYGVMSIYVNPTQFGPNEDFSRYPRTIDEDKAKLQSLEDSLKKELILYLPTSEDIYPNNFNTIITVKNFDSVIEGEKRPGHFQGVATVVYLLFAQVMPNSAYFGEKDYQQLQMIKQMVKDLLLPIKIIGFPIVRDSDGLALSSRNQYLSESQREEALTLPNTLNRLANAVTLEKQSISWLLSEIKKVVENNINWDYLLAINIADFSPATSESKEIVLLAVYRCGKTRLLDNKELIIK